MLNRPRSRRGVPLALLLPALLLLALALLSPAVGCDNQLETGYAPRSLNASEADRRSYYAPAFSPESHPDKEGPAFNLAP